MPPLILVLMIVGWVIVLFRPSVGMLGWLTIIFIGIVAAYQIAIMGPEAVPEALGAAVGDGFLFGLGGLILGAFRKDRSAERADKKLDAKIARIRAEAAAEDASKRGSA